MAYSQHPTPAPTAQHPRPDVENIAQRNKLSVEETTEMLAGFRAALDRAESEAQA